MLRNINRIFLITHGLIVVIIGILLIISQENQQFNDIRNTLINDNGIIEIIIFFILLMISTYATVTIFNNHDEKVFTKARRNLMAFIAVMVYLAAMQELRWGELLNIGVSEGSDNSLRAWVNLGAVNSLDQVYQLLNMLIFVVLVLVPLFVYYDPEYFNDKPALKGKTIIYLPSLHNVFMFCFACFLLSIINPVTWIDKYAIILVLAVYGGVFIQKPYFRTKSNIIHFIVVLGLCLILAAHHDIMNLTSGNSRIWKLVMAYAFFYWLLNWTMTLRQKASWSHPW